MDDTPYVNDGADASLRKTVSLLNKIEANTSSTPAPVTLGTSSNPTVVKLNYFAGSAVGTDGGPADLTAVRVGYNSNSGNEFLAVSESTGLPISGIDLGAKADSVASSDTGTFSVLAFIKRGLQNWTTLLAKIPTLVSGRIPVDGSGVTQPVSGTVALDAASLNALENISVTFPATQNVNVTNAGLNVSVTNLPATQPVSGTIGTFNNTLVNAGSVFNYAVAGNYGLFDAGVDADYVEFRRNGGGGGYVHNLSLSLSDSPFSAGATTAATALVFNDKFPSSSLDTHAYRFSNTNLNSGTSGNFILNLRQGSTKYRYVRVDVTGGGGGNWDCVFASYKSSGLISSGSGLDSTRIQNRVPIAGVVDINSCTRELPCTVSGTVNTYPQQGTSVSNTNFSSITSAELAPASASREVLTVFNEGAGTLFINVGASCSTTSYQVRLLAGDYWEAPAGQQSLQHSGIFSSSGMARITAIS
jgi:hypothetical protein